MCASVWSANRDLGAARDAAIAVMRRAVDELHRAGRLFYGVWGAGVPVETPDGSGTDLGSRPGGLL